MPLERVANSEVQRQIPIAAPPQDQRQVIPSQPPPVSVPPYVVNLSPQSAALSANEQAGVSESSDSVSGGKVAVGPQECQTCQNRKYVDRSNDSTVSFQSPTRLSPGAAETAVRAHEQEHVSNEQAKAGEQGRKVVSQTVAIHYAMCPECGRSYVSGGTTTTVTKADTRPGVVQGGPAPSTGGSVDLRV